MTNHDVVRAWNKGKVAHSRHMATNGVQIYSYGLVIGEWGDGGQRVYNYTARTVAGKAGRVVSVTTSRHVGMLIPYADRVVSP